MQPQKDELTEKETNNESKEDKKNVYKNPWNIFCERNKERVKAENPELKKQGIMKKLSEMYKNLDKEEREKYEAEASKSAKPQQKNESGLSRSELQKKKYITPYYNFMTQRHVSLRQSEPTLTYEQRTEKIMKEWSQLSMIEKGKYEVSSYGSNTASAQPMEVADNDEELDPTEVGVGEASDDDNAGSDNEESKNQEGNNTGEENNKGENEENNTAEDENNKSEDIKSENTIPQGGTAEFVDESIDKNA